MNWGALSELTMVPPEDISYYNSQYWGEIISNL